MSKSIFLLVAVLLTGCLARPHLDQQSFLFSLPSSAALKTTPDHRVLAIRSLQVAEPFASRPFVYRTGENAYDSDPYAGFMVDPANGLISPIGNWFRESGQFNAVTEAGSALKPDTVVEIEVVRLFGDFRVPATPTAILEMRFVFFDAPDGYPGKVILQRDYSQDIPLKARTPAALMEGWNQALAQILTAATLDLSRTKVTTTKP